MTADCSRPDRGLTAIHKSLWRHQHYDGIIMTSQKIWRYHHDVINNMAVSLRRHQHYGGIIMTSSTIWRYHYDVINNMAVSLWRQHQYGVISDMEAWTRSDHQDYQNGKLDASKCGWNGPSPSCYVKLPYNGLEENKKSLIEKVENRDIYPTYGSFQTRIWIKSVIERERGSLFRGSVIWKFDCNTNHHVK